MAYFELLKASELFSQTTIARTSANLKTSGFPAGCLLISDRARYTSNTTYIKQISILYFQLTVSLHVNERENMITNIFRNYIFNFLWMEDSQKEA
jgi:hypothetical protein